MFALNTVAARRIRALGAQRGGRDGVRSIRGKRPRKNAPTWENTQQFGKTCSAKVKKKTPKPHRSGKMCGDPRKICGGPAKTCSQPGKACSRLVKHEASPVTCSKHTVALARRAITLGKICSSPSKIRTDPSKTCSKLVKHQAIPIKHGRALVKHAAALARHAITLIKHAAAPAKYAVIPVRHAAAWSNTQ